MMLRVTASQADVEPIPPRYWWLKRILFAFAVFLGLLIALRLVWGWEANRRLQAEIDCIIAAGEPIYPHDFGLREHVRDDENAATLYLQVGSKLGKPIHELPDDPLLWHDRYEDIAIWVRDRTAELEQTRAARGRSKADWPINFASPVVETLLPSLGDQNLLSRLLCLATWHQHVGGDDMNALETVLDALAHFRAMDEDLFLITHLAMSRRMIFFSQVIEGISPSLAVSPGLPLADNGRVGAGNKLREVIAGLLDETTSENALIRGMLVERMTGLDAVTHIVRARSSVAEFLEIFGKSETRWGPAESRLFSPAIVLDGIVMMRAASTFVAAAGESSYPAANLKLRSGISRSAYLSAWYKDAHPLSTHVFYLGSGVFTKHFHAIAMRRMAATRLAIRLFEIEHDRFPLSLDELVPAYLTTVPRDPFAPVDRSISYLPNNKPPLLYSIGPNGIDDGGRWQPERDRIDDTNLDLPFFLSGEDARGKGPADLP